MAKAIGTNCADRACIVLRIRGYPRWHIAAVFREVTWARRAQILKSTPKKRLRRLAMNFSRPIAPVSSPSSTHRNSRLLRERLDLRLTELIKSTYGDIFPPKVFLAQSDALRLRSILKR